MIVRIATEGQYRLADDAVARVNALDNEAVAAVEAGDEARFTDLFGQILALIRDEGAPLPDHPLHGSCAIMTTPASRCSDARYALWGAELIPDSRPTSVRLSA